MAFVDTLTGYGKEFPIINVTAAVGTNGQNYTDDVILVKTLLYIIFGSSTVQQHLRELKIPLRKPLPLYTSGTLDNTIGFIYDYQKFINASAAKLGASVRLAVDGRVSRARGRTEWGLNRPWTIVGLNEDAELYVHDHGYESLGRFIYDKCPLLRDKIDPNLRYRSGD